MGPLQICADAGNYCIDLLADVLVWEVISRATVWNRGTAILPLFKQLRGMKKYLVLLILLYCTLLHAQTDTSSKYIQPTSTVYITHVNVVNVITKKIDADQTVIIG